MHVHHAYIPCIYIMHMYHTCTSYMYIMHVKHAYHACTPCIYTMHIHHAYILCMYIMHIYHARTYILGLVHIARAPPSPQQGRCCCTAAYAVLLPVLQTDLQGYRPWPTTGTAVSAAAISGNVHAQLSLLPSSATSPKTQPVHLSHKI
jgi:hypothetical protein